VSCAVGLAVLDVIEREHLQHKLPDTPRWSEARPR
jgi:4-aminobutyrate aminotransferase-like enzyme